MHPSRSVTGALVAVTVVAATAVLGAGTATAQPAPPGTRIHDVQGTTRTSPLAGQAVTVPGVVTGVRAFGSARGFWFQDPQPDDDPATSEGLFAFTGSQTPAVRVGDAVDVTGTVSEFRPGGATTANQTITQLTSPQAVVRSSGNPLPAAEVLGERTIPEQYAPEPRGGGTIEGVALDPRRYALDFFESREGMLVSVADARVTGATDDFNGLFVTTKPRQNATDRGGALYASYRDQNSGRVKIESLIPFAQRPFPQVNVGDRIAGATSGPLDYSQFGGYVLQATTLGQPVSGGIAPEVTTLAPANDRLRIATYNVENLDPGDDPAIVARLAQGVVTNLRSPDVVGLEEIQDNSGATDDGTVSSTATLDMFVAAVRAAGGPAYEYRVIDPVNNADGGQPGGNIRVAFLFDPARVQFVDRPGGSSTTATTPVRDGRSVALSSSPGRIDPGNPAWVDSRKPLAGEFLFQGQRVIVVANHFASKGGDQPIHGVVQPPQRSSEVQRVAQAQVVRGFVDAVQRIDRNANVVVMGDLNDFPFSPTIDALTGRGGLRALVDTLPRDERYNYVFDGNSQTLDHILVSRSLGRVDYDVVRINAEFADQASDHDPLIASIRLR